VTPHVAPVLSETAAALCVVFILLVPFAAAGLSLINTGLGRSRSAAHSMMASLCMIAVAALSYFVCGFAWQGFPGRPSHVLTVAGRSWDWIAAEPFFLRGVKLDGSPVALAVWFQMLSVGLVALIPLGAGGDRWRLGPSCVSTALLAGLTYPLFAHWAWGGGWLAQLGFLDAGGSGSIHTLGGLTALSVAWIVGPRRGKFAQDGMPAAIPGHNTVLVLFGCLLALLGWLGLNSAGAILFSGVEPGRAALIGINTLLAASAAALTAAGITRSRFGRPDASLSANGWVAGLVSSSAACAFVAPTAAVVIGVIAGALTPFAVEWFELHFSVDDPGGVISVHAVGGIWGLLALGVFASVPGQGLAQLVGIATLLGLVLPLTYGLNWLLNRIYPYRVAVEGERQGMDLHELGAGAYPEFVTHNEEFTQR
jgi:Amt family ammonium transporter